MGKYQLDYKGQQKVTRFHEKHSKGQANQKAKKEVDLKAQFAAKILRRQARF